MGARDRGGKGWRRRRSGIVAAWLRPGDVLDPSTLITSRGQAQGGSVGNPRNPISCARPPLPPRRAKEHSPPPSPSTPMSSVKSRSWTWLHPTFDV
jgi:hypothetical protein